MMFPSYPEYKEAEVEWLDEVPEHWCSAPIKYMALERNSLFLDGDWIESKDISSEGIRYITTGNVGEGAYKEQGVGFVSEETFYSLGCTEVYKGDILISRLNNPIGRACITPDLGGRVVTSVDNVIFRPDAKYHKKFIVYLFSSEEYFRHTGNLARGTTMQRISRGVLGNIRVIIPPLSEQTQIARFLDYETARIDALIEEQQRLIELLKEKRQAVISHAVTKGLDSTVPMKDSGVEWLGEVPAHWESWKISHAFGEIGSGTTPATSEAKWYENGNIPWVTTGELRENVIWETKKLLSSTALSAFSALRLHPAGSLAIAMYGATIGRLGILGVDATTNQACCLLTRPKDLHVKFTFYWLLAFKQSIIDLYASGGGQPNINQEVIANLKISAPGVPEQTRIAYFLDYEVARVDALIDEQQLLTELLQERRSALISAAVTGKIDVRGWQPPAQAPSPESAQEVM